MNKYVDFVLCQKLGAEPTLYYAPGFSHIKKGDMVLVEGEVGRQTADVIASTTVAKTEVDLIDMLMRLAGVKDCKKVLATYSIKEVDFSKFEEEEDTQNE